MLKFCGARILWATLLCLLTAETWAQVDGVTRLLRTQTVSSPRTSAVVSSPAIGPDGSISVGIKISPVSGTADGSVATFNANFSVKWTFDYPIAPTDWIESSPAVATDGTVYVGSWDGYVYAISPPSIGTFATLRWSFNTGGYVYGSPAIGSDGTVYVGAGDFSMHAINGSTGSERWEFPTGDWIDSSPAVGSDGAVYFGSWDSNIYAVTSTGAEKWRLTTGGAVLSSPAIGKDGTVYCGSSDGKLYAISADGELRWSYTTGDAIESSAVIDADGTIYFGANDGYFYAINSDGTLKWRTNIGQPIASTPALRADGSLVFGADDSKLHILSATGAKQSTYTLYAQNDAVDTSPVIGAGGTIYMGTIDGYFHAIYGAVAPMGSSAPWPMFRHDARHTGASLVPAIAVHPQSQSANAGSPVSLSVTAAGSSLSYQWYRDGTLISGATAASYSMSAPSTADSGRYTVTVTNAYGAVTSQAAQLTVVPTSYLTNLSVRAAMNAGQTLIVGFVVAGGAKPVLVRAAGPALNPYGLTGVADPQLGLFDGSTLIAQNDDWPLSLASTFATVGAFAFSADSKDAALLQSVTGPHTAQAAANSSGAILVEAYDAGPNDGRRFTNVSARYQVGTGDNILIAGFAVGGAGTRQVLVRAVGPTLASYGVPGTLADPRFEVFDGGTVIASDNDWSPALASAFSTLGAFALNSGSKDAALVVTLQASKSYTVQVAGADGGTGEALVELYVLP